MGQNRGLAGHIIAMVAMLTLSISWVGTAHAEDAVAEPQVVAVPAGEAPVSVVPRAVSAVHVRASTVRVRATWAMVDGANAYSVQLLAQNRNRHVVKRMVVAGNRARFFQKLPVGAEVQICVLARNAAGAAPAVCRTQIARAATPSGQ